MSRAVLCVGSGTDVTEKTADRRNLDSDCSNVNEVAALWKDIVSSKVSEETTELDSGELIADAVRNHRMCRRCFTNYTRLLKLEKTIFENLDDALEALIPASTVLLAARRQRSAGRSPPPKRSNAPPLVTGSSSGVSPTVSVSSLFVDVFVGCVFT